MESLKNYKPIILILIVVAAVFFVYNRGYNAGELSAARKSQPLLQEASRYFQPIPEFSSLSGRVLEAGEREISVQIQGLPQNPFEKLPPVRRVSLGEATIVLRQTEKNNRDYQKEFAAYQKKLQASVASAGSVAPPSTVEERPASFSEIKKGDIVIVDAATPIKMKPEFTAVKIVIRPVE